MLSVVYGTGPLSQISTIIEVEVPYEVDVIEADLPSQTDSSAPSGTQRQRVAAELAALYAGLGLHPLTIEQNLINDQLVTKAPPMTEPVTSNGNTSLWGPGAQ